MSGLEHIPTTTPAELIDRLVDGELDVAERRALLAHLDREPGGWRRCALAFLEAQGWREVLGPAKPKGAFDPDFDSPEPRPWRRRTWPIAGRWLLAAAVVLAGFVAGRATNSQRVATVTPATTSVFPSPEEFAGPTDDPVLATTPPSEPVAVQAIGYVRLARGLDQTTADSIVKVPVLAGPGLDESWLRSQPSFVPEPVRRKLENRGYVVERQRRLMSVQVDDRGSYFTIPVDDVRVRYVGQTL